MSKDTKTTKTTNADSSSVSIIKNLIFGEEIRVFNEQFKLLEKQLDDHKRLFDKKIQLLSEEIAGNLSNLDASLQQKIKANHNLLLKQIQNLDKDKVDRKKLATILQQIAEEV